MMCEMTIYAMDGSVRAKAWFPVEEETNEQGMKFIQLDKYFPFKVYEGETITYTIHQEDEMSEVRKVEVRDAQDNKSEVEIHGTKGNTQIGEVTTLGAETAGKVEIVEQRVKQS